MSVATLGYLTSAKGHGCALWLPAHDSTLGNSTPVPTINPLPDLKSFFFAAPIITSLISTRTAVARALQPTTAYTRTSTVQLVQHSLPASDRTRRPSFDLSISHHSYITSSQLAAAPCDASRGSGLCRHSLRSAFTFPVWAPWLARPTLLYRVRPSSTVSALHG